MWSSETSTTRATDTPHKRGDVTMSGSIPYQRQNHSSVSRLVSVVTWLPFKSLRVLGLMEHGKNSWKRIHLLIPTRAKEMCPKKFATSTMGRSLHIPPQIRRSVYDISPIEHDPPSQHHHPIHRRHRQYLLMPWHALGQSKTSSRRLPNPAS